MSIKEATTFLFSIDFALWSGLLFVVIYKGEFIICTFLFLFILLCYNCLLFQVVVVVVCVKRINHFDIIQYVGMCLFVFVLRHR
jgi:hypothetical protein